MGGADSGDHQSVIVGQRGLFVLLAVLWQWLSVLEPCCFLLSVFLFIWLFF